MSIIVIRNKRFLYIPGCINSYTKRMAWIAHNMKGQVLMLFCFIFYTILHTYVLALCSSFLPQKLTGSQLVKKSPHFMENKVSLQHSQMPPTCPYPEPITVDQSMSEAPDYTL
jgi:hypothetical protein